MSLKTVLYTGYQYMIFWLNPVHSDKKFVKELHTSSLLEDTTDSERKEADAIKY
jgi:hypothetical protein